MAIYVPLTDGAQLEFVCTFGGEIVENRLWLYYIPTGPTITELQQAAEGATDWYTTWILPYLSDQLRLELVRVTSWDSPPGGVTGFTVPALNGGIGGAVQSANIAVRVPFRWPLQFRRRKNSNFIPGIPDSAIALNTVDPTFAGRLFDAYVALIDAATTWSPGSGWVWVVTHQVEGGAPLSEQEFGLCIGPTPASSYKVTTRRKRLPPPP